MFLDVIIILFTTMICFPTHSAIECAYVMCASHMSLSHGGLLATIIWLLSPHPDFCQAIGG